jgi:hypothetical protein
MKKRSRQGLRRFQVEVSFYGNYVERIAELERTLAKKPRVIQIELVGTGEIPADAALRFRAVLMERSPKTRIVTKARSSLQGGSVLLWLLGDSRTIRNDARLYFRRTTWSEEDEVQENGGSDELPYRDSYSSVDPEEGDYARVLEVINEFLPVKEMAGRLIGVPVLRQFGLIENEKADNFLAAVFSKRPEPAESSLNAMEKRRVQRCKKSAHDTSENNGSRTEKENNVGECESARPHFQRTIKSTKLNVWPTKQKTRGKSS